MKYVILLEEVGDGIQRTHHMIFPDHMVHYHVAVGYAAAFKSDTKRIPSVLTAGTCWQDDEEGWWVCERGSKSLGVPKASESESADDAAVLNRPEAFNGLVY